jgi:hypothetical protein
MKLSRPHLRVNQRIAGLLHGAILCSLALVACGSDGPTAIEIPIARIEITSPCTIMIEGDQCQIGVRAFAEDGRRIGNPVLRFISTNSSTADVTAEGVVIGRAPGSATIFVANSTGSVNQQFSVSVLPRGPGK